MLADKLEQILIAELEANQVKHIILDKSKKSLEQAKADGKNSIIEARTRADHEIVQLKQIADQKAMKDATELASSTANRLATMHARSEKRMEMVAERIFERIRSV